MKHEQFGVKPVTLVKRCPYCGSKVDIDAINCDNCGKKIKEWKTVYNFAKLSKLLYNMGFVICVAYVIYAIVEFILLDILSGIVALVTAAINGFLFIGLSKVCTRVDLNTAQIAHREEEIEDLRGALEELIREMNPKEYKETIQKKEDHSKINLYTGAAMEERSEPTYEEIKKKTAAIHPKIIDADTIECPVCGQKQRLGRTYCLNCDQDFLPIEEIKDEPIDK